MPIPVTKAIQDAIDRAEREGRVRDHGRTGAAAIDDAGRRAGATTDAPRPKLNLPVERLAALFGRYFGDAEREYRFHPDRRWRFDLAFPRHMLAVEYEGLMAAKSRHTTVTGFDADAEKYSTAALLGWRVVRVTAIMLRDGRADALADLAHATLTPPETPT